MNSPRLTNILFVDIECVPQHSSFYDLDDDMQKLWEKKASYMMNHAEDGTTVADLYENRSGIYAEFGKIIVISAGYISIDEDSKKTFKVQSFSWDDESKILHDFFELLNAKYNQKYHRLCGHNLKEFDVPYVCRRAMIHDIQLPDILDLAGKKPREVNHIDTLEYRKFGDRKNFTSLDLLCRINNIETPKNDISGEQVAKVYRDEKDLPRIQAYCEKDVVATAKLYLKFVRKSSEMPEDILV